jgi:hypothetical protein
VVNDGMMTQAESFVLEVTPVNDPPTISNIRDRTIPPSSSTGPLKFTIKDVETPASRLNVEARSSNTLLAPEMGISLSGNNGTRTISVTPLPLLTGSAVITLTVSDGELTRTESFTLNVAAGAPTYLLNEGFEPTGYENSGWLEVGTPNEDYAAAPLADTQSLRCNGGQQVYRTLSGLTTFSLYTQIRWSTWKTNHTIMDFMDTGGSPAGFIWAGNDGSLSVYHGQNSARGSSLLQTGVTYHLWLDWSSAGIQGGRMALYISTTAMRPSSPEAILTNGTGGALSRVYFGSPSTGPLLDFDNILLDDAPIGSNPGY